MNNALTIAGSDSCGGAGIQGDLKTFAAHGIYGMSVITAITAQNTQGVTAVSDVDPQMISAQIKAILDDISVHSIKIGMVSKAPSIEAIGNTLKEYKLPPIVLDPVMVSKNGYHLLSHDAIDTLVNRLFPLSHLITPNLPEAEVLLNREISSIDEMKKACIDLLKLGPKNILLKGGHLQQNPSDVFYDGEAFLVLHGDRINTIHTHGTGCTLSSAIAANLSNGLDIKTSVIQGKKYVTKAIEHGFPLGKGVGPTHHFYSIYKRAGIF